MIDAKLTTVGSDGPKGTARAGKRGAGQGTTTWSAKSF